MSEQVSLAYSVQPSGYSSLSISIIPPAEDGSLNTDAIVAVNIASPVAGTPESLLLDSITALVAEYRATKGI